MKLEDIEMWILAGGKGTRLASVWKDKPKILVPVAGRPYFDWLIEALTATGFLRFRFLLGMGWQQVVDGRPRI